MIADSSRRDRGALSLPGELTAPAHGNSPRYGNPPPGAPGTLRDTGTLRRGHGNSPRQRSLLAGVAATDPRPAQTAPFVRIGGVPGPRVAAFVKPSYVVARAQRRR